MWRKFTTISFLVALVCGCDGFGSISTPATPMKRTNALHLKNHHDDGNPILSCLPSNEETRDDGNKHNNYMTFQRMCMSIFVAILTITIATTDVCVSMTPDQLLVDDVWRVVSKKFVDPTFNGQGEDGWKRQRLKAIQKVSEFGPDEENKVYGVIRGMLNTLNDPYTRFLTPEQYETLTMAYTNPSTRATTPISEGGIGVQLIGDNKDADRGKVVVANIIAKSPAEKAGLRPGDSILFINGVDMTGATAEVVANSCRGENGTTVRLEIERSSTEIPATPSSATSSNRQTITVTRAPLKSTPTVEASTMIVSSRQTNEHSNIDSNSNANRKVGILKINTFTQETEQMVRQELQKFVVQDQQNNEQQPTELAVSAIIIDLRSNLGGYMPAGVDVAKLFLPSRARIISEIDNTGRATIYINDGVGGSDTDTQLYVLVDRRSASASEILTAALQDNKRATVVSGESRTFGKGRIQNVQPVSSGGGGIAVTKARYVTPKGSDIQNVGIVPDIRLENCEAQDSATTCLEGIL